MRLTSDILSTSDSKTLHSRVSSDIFCNAIGGRFVLGTEEGPTAISPPRNAKDAPGK